MARTREFDTDLALEGAMEVFRERGYEGASTRELGEAMGIGPGSLYAAFGSKDKLYVAALARHREHLDATVDRVLTNGQGTRAILGRLLRQAYDGSDPSTWGPGCLLMRAATERAGRDPSVDRMLRDATTAVQMSFVDVITAGRRSGEVTSERDPAVLAHYLVTVIQGLRVMSLLGSPREGLAATVEVALSCLG